MTEGIHDLVDAATAGRPVYISVVRERFEALPASESFRLVARVDGFGGEDRVFAFTLPKFGALAPDERAMVIEYVLASIYNILSTLGGRSLALDAEGDDGEGAELAAAVAHEFGIELPRLSRPGFGRAVNVSERMDEAISPIDTPSRGRFRLTSGGPAAGPRSAGAPTSLPGGIDALCERAATNMEGTSICGIDIGGTDIKLCLAVNGKVARFIEYDWFPAAFTTIDQIIDPILVLVRLMCLEGARAAGSPGATPLDEVTLLPGPFLLDAIGVCFPDVVVRDKIVGGEVYKTRGMREHLGSDYESEFRRLSGLDVALRVFVKPDGAVGIINDGPMAAFTAAVELGVLDPMAIRDGVFAHTLGTELGTGWVTEDGTIPDIPLEIYNCIIDLGSYPERRFAPDDVRSVNNFNTRLSGTLQKYTSQSGVFRLAAKYLPDEDPALFAELLGRGLLVASDGGLSVPTDPTDQRKPLLEFLMEAADQGGHPAVDRIFREVGEFMAVAWLESKWLLDPAVDQRILFGRLVKRRACFDLMTAGAKAIAPALELVVADDEMANTALMRQLRDSDEYTVAQFAQAVGAVHYANFRRNRPAEVGHAGAGVAVGVQR